MSGQGWGAAAQAGSAIVGGIIGDKSSQKRLDRQLMHDYRVQKEFAQMGLQWRVQDAQAAGLHPLFAIGGSGATYTPSAVAVGESGLGRGIAEAGQAVGRALAAQETAEQRAIREAQLKLLGSQSNAADAQATYYRSEAAKNVGQVPPAFPSTIGERGSNPDIVKINPVDPLGQYRGLDHVPLAWDAGRFEPDSMVSRSSAYPGQTAGRGHASFREFEMPNGDLLYLPATQGGGIPEEIDMAMIPEIVGANIRRYGFNQAVWGALHRWLGSKYSEGMYTPGSEAWMQRWNYPRDYPNRRYFPGR